MTKSIHRVLCLIIFLLVGCGNENKEAGQVRVSSDNPFKTQVDAVERAKDVERLIKVQAEHRKQMMEDQVNR